MGHYPYKYMGIFIVASILLKRQHDAMVVEPVVSLDLGCIVFIMRGVAFLPGIGIWHHALNLVLDPTVFLVKFDQEMVEAFLGRDVL